ncbi:hypothetical protein I6N90_12240 [Paenibacillus sp. GSMTC-2017]|uniref:hypothetical protein n=1 Tax=Paenibacillus sp. GSMTC-2017 TaxID=2794350 RepID=UPI0018D5F8FC|nr:hypothetical protein [Paenibacillus sp. GSMTC-2017]MBH5318565.1 hypothetical protein [Paenibacillus sp. GSMTC-2017]
MRAGYSILREIQKKGFTPEPSDYGLKEWEFKKMIQFLQDKGFLDRVLRVGDHFSLKNSQITTKGSQLLEDNQHYELDYPDRAGLKEWVKVEKEQYSNSSYEE